MKTSDCARKVKLGLPSFYNTNKCTEYMWHPHQGKGLAEFAKIVKYIYMSILIIQKKLATLIWPLWGGAFLFLRSKSITFSLFGPFHDHQQRERQHVRRSSKAHHATSSRQRRDHALVALLKLHSILMQKLSNTLHRRKFQNLPYKIVLTQRIDVLLIWFWQLLKYRPFKHQK